MADGEGVAFLGVLDTSATGSPNGARRPALPPRVYRHLYGIDLHIRRMMCLSPGEQAAYVWDGVPTEIGKLLRRMVGRRVCSRRAPARRPACRAEASEAASERYVSQGYAAGLSVALTREMPYRSYSPTRLTWVQLAKGGAEVSLVPGDHLGMIREPHVQGLAPTIGASMDRAGVPLRS